MKTCPDCAESIQDAARKCRYCGYRFDEEGVATASAPRKKAKANAPAPAAPAAERAPEVVAAVATATTATATATRAGIGAHLPLAIGGALFALSTLFWAIGALSGPQSPFGGIGVGGLGLSGIVIAIGWGVLVPRGKGSIGAALGALALPVGIVIVLLMAKEANGLSLSPGAATETLVELAMTMLLTVLVTMVAHYMSLDDLTVYVLARLGAAIAAIGLGYEVYASAKHWDLPGFLDVIAIILAVAGSILFGAGLTLGAVVAAKE